MNQCFIFNQDQENKVRAWLQNHYEYRFCNIDKAGNMANSRPGMRHPANTVIVSFSDNDDKFKIEIKFGMYEKCGLDEALTAALISELKPISHSE